ncbi:hypothetical protein LEN26_000579 [Aphanomyces euteiches]|nr:hypothetical protein AeMF1_003510 [Aphanomyces euteiches]KAH9163270.1 hypothetical protein LEN26_000579 [Aphanomyces euteiches]KAH9190294.1 hypothetical protein AeNC1_007725 [Aphanomyces euteiches]
MERLTLDAVTTFFDRPTVHGFHPFLQVLHVKALADVGDPLCLVVSDGKFYMTCLYKPQKKEESCGIHVHCIVQLIDVVPKFVADQMILVATTIAHIACCPARIGQPIFRELHAPSMCAFLQAQLDLLLFKERVANSFITAVNYNANAATEMVTLNVGGQRFQTAASNLLRHPMSYFTYMLQEPPSDNEYFIDADPIHFDRIMVHLRTGDPLSYDGLSLWETLQLRKTVRYLGLEHHCTSMDIFIEHMNYLTTTTSA